MASTDAFTNTEQGTLLNSLQRVDWGLDPNKGAQAAIEKNLNTLQDSLESSSDAKKRHGMIPINGNRYEAMVVGDNKTYSVQIKKSDLSPIFAIALGSETAIISPENNDNVVLFMITKEEDGGTKIIIQKAGLAPEEEKHFTSEEIVDQQKLDDAKTIKRSSFGNFDFNQIMENNKRSEQLVSEATKHISKDHEELRPVIENRIIPIKYRDLSFKVLGVDNSFLLIQAESSFDLQVFTSKKE